MSTDLIIFIVLSLGLLLRIYVYFFRDNPERIQYPLLIIFKFIPKYKELIEKYGATYPCVLGSVDDSHTTLHNLKEIRRLKSYVFIKNDAFNFISTTNPAIYAEIPFESIIYCKSKIFPSDDSKYSFYSTEIYFKHNKVTESFHFNTLEYNHKLDKRYPNLLNDTNLHNFILENFRVRKLDSNVTSIFS